MKRVFVFSYHGKETYQTSYYRLLSLASFLAKKFEVYFVHGSTDKNEQPINVQGNFIEIPLNYNHGILQRFYNFLLNKSYFSTAKFLLICYYFLFGKEIFDLGREFENYMAKTNFKLKPEDTVVVSYPSFAVHNLGNNLKNKYNCNLILDYRDPGVFGYQAIAESKLVSYLRRKFLQNKEVKFLENADAVTTVSEAIKNLFPQRYQDKITVVRNGFIAEKANLSRITKSEKVFKLVYLGTIFNIQLEDLTFFKAVRKFIDSNSLLPSQFQLKFVGSETTIKHNTQLFHQVIRDFNLEPYTIITKRTDIEKAYEQLYDASMFFHLKYGDRKEIITSKQYEYLAFQKPILLPSSDSGDLAQSIEKYDAGYVCNTVNEVVETLSFQYELHCAGIGSGIKRSEEEVFELSRSFQEQRFVQIVDGFEHVIKKVSQVPSMVWTWPL